MFRISPIGDTFSSFPEEGVGNTNKMKILLVALVLGLVCADQEPHLEEDCSQISGTWRCIYLGSSNKEVIKEGLGNTNKMKVLLVTLILGLVYADPLEEPLLDEYCSEISGTWYTIYEASANIEVLSENSPLRGYLRLIECLPDGETLLVIFYTKENGTCQLYNKQGQRIDKNGYTTNYEGKVDFSFIQQAKDFLLIYVINKNEEGNVFKVVGALAREKDISEENYQAFLEFAVENGIPKENIVKVIDTDTCPETPT
ncbi:odorant-binding protein-like [Loxodonta africana]|uniref:odorant-binding protein-like n=1 Tax=Loxodonta africana TaxID=9785 RepID=UPI0030CD9CE0